ncbi:hypothetical protein SBOR_4371 [Sclerotinia borealis F-4128]|uniref:Uncharacterized protein n=1 Tax=Sclerotinia borealis (strain F-4128) TaxID=1432307 RepID=W9CKT3_SCLBF|nr:hypothetical protein SBOR_4371 [Sclerotinia borealis F-4128]
MFSRLSINSHDSSDQPSPLTSSSSTSSLLEGAHLSLDTAVDLSEAPDYAISCVNGLSSAGLFEDAAVISQGYLHEKPNNALLLKHLAKGLFETEHYSEASQIYQRLEAMQGLADDEQKKLWTIKALLNDDRPGTALDVFLSTPSLEESAKGLYFKSRALRKLKQPAAARVAAERMIETAGENIVDDYWVEYGLVLYDLQDFAGSLQYLRQGATEDVIESALGLAGQVEEAEDMFNSRHKLSLCHRREITNGPATDWEEFRGRANWMKTLPELRALVRVSFRNSLPEPEDLAGCLCILGTRHREVGAHEAASACFEHALRISHTSAFVLSMAATNLAANVPQNETDEARFARLQKADELWEQLLQIGPYTDGTFEVPHAEIYHRRAELWKCIKTPLYEKYLFKYAEIVKSPEELISVAKVLRSNQKTDGINTIAYKERAERVDQLYYEALHSPEYSPTHAPQKAAQVYGWRVDNLAYGDIDPERQERFLRQKMELDSNPDRLLNFIGKAGGRDHEVLQLLESAERKFGGKYVALVKDQRKYLKSVEKRKKTTAKKLPDDAHKYDPVQRNIKQTRVAAGWQAWKAQK